MIFREKIFECLVMEKNREMPGVRKAYEETIDEIIQAFKDVIVKIGLKKSMKASDLQKTAYEKHISMEDAALYHAGYFEAISSILEEIEK